MDLQQRMIAAARGWIGTRFQHQGRRKVSRHDRGGVDCLGLLVGVAAECGVMKDGMPIAAHDERDYGHIPDANRLSSNLQKYLQVIDTSQMQAGDVLLLKMDGNAQHLAIVSDYGDGLWGMIHAYAPAKAVVEHRLDEGWMRRIYRVYRVG